MDNNVIIPVLIFSLFFFIFGLLRFIKRKKYEISGIKVKAVIADLRFDVKSGVRAYFPTVKFSTLEGIEVVIESRFGSYPSIFSKSEDVNVIYMPNDYKNFIITSYKYTCIEVACLSAGTVGVTLCICKLLHLI